MQNVSGLQSPEDCLFRSCLLSDEVFSAREAWTPKRPTGLGTFSQLEPETRRVLRPVLPYSDRGLGLGGQIKRVFRDWAGVAEHLKLKGDVQVSFCRGAKPLRALVLDPHRGLKP